MPEGGKMNEQEMQMWLVENLHKYGEWYDTGKWGLWYDDLFELCRALLKAHEEAVNKKGGRW